VCYLAQVSRAGFYRSLVEKTPAEEELEVRSAIQKIAIEHGRRYGYRRITAELRRQGMQVNRKRVARIMREDNLLAIQPRAFGVTTDSHHQLEVYLNLAGRMKLTGINLLWVADITYIRLQREFVYVAVILDTFSRKVVGWALIARRRRAWRWRRCRKQYQTGNRRQASCITPIAASSMPQRSMWRFCGKVRCCRA